MPGLVPSLQFCSAKLQSFSLYAATMYYWIFLIAHNNIQSIEFKDHKGHKGTGEKDEKTVLLGKIKTNTQIQDEQKLGELQMRTGTFTYPTCKPHICLLTNHNIFLTVRKLNKINSNNSCYYTIHSHLSSFSFPSTSSFIASHMSYNLACYSQSTWISCADWSQMGTIMMNSMSTRCVEVFFKPHRICLKIY